ncbi:hypothetical protein, partial [Sinorhizobium sp. GL28]|uniref:hypothetical protein n=1 Tax=Sinorhizobium sp. GL28 TaxID=1358418 RepID=UPI001AECE0B2
TVHKILLISRRAIAIIYLKLRTRKAQVKDEIVLVSLPRNSSIFNRAHGLNLRTGAEVQAH